MSWSGPNPRCDPALLLTPEHPASITTSTLEDAAKAAGTDIPGVVANLVRSLAIWTAGQPVAKTSTGVSYAAVEVIKTSAPQRYSLGLAYPAMKADVAVAQDGHRDFVSETALEKTAWEWMAKHREIGLFHQGGTEGHCTVVESYIYRGPDWTITSPVDGSEVVIKAGDWMLGGVWDEYGWDLVEKRKVNGWSPEGGARRSVPSAARLMELRS